jgi:autophagy-related protein 2
LIVGPLAPDPSDLINSEPLPPVVEIMKVFNHSTGSKASMVTCRIPSVQAKIEQPTIEGLQFFADDITHWLDGAFGDGSAPRPRDDLKMIGSRFFGSKGSSSASNSDEELDDPMAATVLRVLATEVDVALHVPRGGVGEQGEQGERVLALHASDLETKVESNTAGKQETTVSVTVMDASFVDRTTASAPIEILRRTIPLSLTSNTTPLLSLRFSSLTDPATQTKETGISVTTCTAAVFITKDLAWIAELKSFAKTPEGVFEDVVPSEITRISLQVYDCSVHVSAPGVPGALLVVVGDLDVRTDVVSDADESTLELGASVLRVMAIDDCAMGGVLGVGYADTAEAWRVS